MRISVLGPLDIDGAAAPLGPRDRIVIEVLSLNPGGVVSAERLADALWGDEPPASWKKVVHGCILRLRRVLGNDTIRTTPHGYQLVLSSGEVDSQRFSWLVNRGRELLTLGEPERAAHLFGDAMALWRGRPLVDIEEWDTGRIEAARLEELRRDVEELALEAALRAGRHREVLAEAQARVAEYPLRERRWGLLARAEYQSGRQAEALRTLLRARAFLVAETGIDPGAELVALEQSILRQDPSLSVDAVGPGPSAFCPYLGLLPYGIGDSEVFFGRERATADALHTLRTEGVVVVVGPSGSGKSSLVRAGLAAALARDGRRVMVVTPGPHPGEAMSGLPSHHDFVLVVDQCEEAVTLCDDPAEQARFFAAVADHAERGPVVMALRADRLGDVSGHAGFARLVEKGLHLLGAMDEADLRAAIEGPAHHAGLLLEPGLIDLLVRELEGEPGALPLLSHALRRTWELREGRTLTVSGYRETGGIRGAVAQSAEELYGSVGADQQAAVRDLMLRLVTPTPEGDAVSSPAPHRTVATDEPHARVIEMLVDARLVTSDGDVVELAHEALTRAWPRLRTWLDDDVEGLRILRHLTLAADSWEALGRPASELYRGVRLDAALAWRERNRPNLTRTEASFLDAGEELAHTEYREAQARVRRATRTNRQLRGLLIGAGCLLAVAIAAVLLLVREADRANTAAVAADARRVGAEALLAEDVDRSLLLAVEGVRLDDSPDTRATLLAALTENPLLVASARSGGPVATLDIGTDGQMLFVGPSAVPIEVRDAATLEMAGTIDGSAHRLAVRPTGDLLAVASDYSGSDIPDFDGRPVRLVDPVTLAEVPVQLGDMPEDGRPWALSYDATGRHLAVSFMHYQPDEPAPTSSSVVIWDLEQPATRFATVELPSDTDVPEQVLSPDGEVLYVGSVGPSPFLKAIEVGTGRDITSVGLSPWALAISPDGTRVAASDGADVVVLDAGDLTEMHRLRGHTNDILALRFSHDGTTLASGSEDATAIVWDVETGLQRAVVTGHEGPVRGLVFSPDDTTLHTGALDGALLTWDLSGGRRFVSLRAVADLGELPFLQLVSPTGDAIAYTFPGDVEVGDSTTTVQFLDLASGRLSPRLDVGHGQWGAASWHPDGERFATAGGDGHVRIWDWRTQRMIAERRIADGHVAGLDYVPDGSRLVVGERSGAVTMIDADTLQPTGVGVDLEARVYWAFAGPDAGTAVALTDATEDFTLVDLEEGVVLYEAGAGASWVDASPDGRRIAFSGDSHLFDVINQRWLEPETSGHRGFSYPVAYAPDGSSFVTGGSDGRVLLWDGSSGELRGALPADYGTWPMASFLPDSRTVILASHEPTSRVYGWDTGLDHWIEFACGVAGRNLTEDEWQRAFDDRPYGETCP